jgi:hypothetical protein
VGALAGGVLVAFGGEYLNQIVDALGEFMNSLAKQVQGGDQLLLAAPDATQVAGMLAAGTAATSVLCLLLARYWQAALYNPGGFGKEFRALYYPPLITVALALSATGLFAMGAEYRTWAMICVQPLALAGLALVHARAAAHRQGRGWLTGFYVLWVIFDPVKLLVVLAAVVDSWFNFRRRWAAKPGSDVSEGDRDDPDR